MSPRSRRWLLALLGLLVLLGGGGAWLANDAETLLRIAIWQERGASDLVRHTTQLQGHDIVYLDGGAPDGEPVLLIHGYTADKDNWTRFSRSLADAGYRVIAPDLPGHGESSRLQEHTYDIANQVAFVRLFVDALDLGPVHVAGNSMGGQIAGTFGAMHPDRTRTVGLLAPGGLTAPVLSERLIIMRETGTNPLLVTDVDDFDRLLAFLFVEPPPLPRVVKQHFADRAVQNRTFNAKIWSDLVTPTRAALEPLLPKLTMPTLILWGDSDRVLHPSGGDVLAAGIPHATRVTMTGCGHSPMIERPGETARHYLAFLAGAANQAPQ